MHSNLLFTVIDIHREHVKVLIKALFWMFYNPQVDPGPYFDACVLEACSCAFKGKFLGFCTAVAAYAEACSDNNVCIRWRRPDLCRTC